MAFTKKDAEDLREIVAKADRTIAKLRGQNDRLRGQLKRMEARAVKAEKLAEARLHGRGVGFGGRKCVPPAPPVPDHAGLS